MSNLPSEQVNEPGAAPTGNREAELLALALRDSIAKSGNCGKVSEKKAIVVEFAGEFQRFLDQGGDPNHITPRQRYIKGAPLWLACLIFMESTLEGVKSVERRQKELASVFQVLSQLPLALGISGGRSATSWACFFGAWASADWLLPRDENFDGAPIPIYLDAIVKSSSAKNVELGLAMLEKLTTTQADINRQSRWSGISPLMRACAFSAVEQIEWLLAHGADPNTCDNNGATAVMHALSPQFGIGDFGTRKRACQTLELLFAHGAKMTGLSVTSQNFGNLLTECKALKRPDKQALKARWESLCKEEKGLRSRKLPAGEFTLEGKVTPADIKKLDSGCEFLLYPYTDMLILLLDFLFERGITRFTLTDILTLINSDWNGVTLGFGRDLSRRPIELVLGKLVIGRRVRALNSGLYRNLARDLNSGYYAIVNSEFEGVLESQIPAEAESA